MSVGAQLRLSGRNERTLIGMSGSFRHPESGTLAGTLNCVDSD